ncbi:MAG TPA: IclR family transcriptional regulator [Acidimicrobiia bacterium]|nr:IclR family transcriptional regulator [Acidimicrobiia bacterium]
MDSERGNTDGENADRGTTGRDSSANTHQSLHRAAAILRTFTEAEPQRSVSDIARQLDLHKSTVSRILAALADDGLVWQNARTGRYALGLGLVELAGVALGQIDVRAASMPHIERLASTLGETVTVAVLRADEAVTVAHAASPHSVRHVSWIGRRIPLATTATGRVFLAARAGTRRSGAGDGSATDREERMARELSLVRRRGYAIEIDEFEPGGAGVAVPIHDAAGSVVAAIGVHGPIERFGAEERLAAIPMLHEAARDIALELGSRKEASA